MINNVIAIIFLLFFITTSALFFPIAVIIWLFTVLFDRRLVALHLFTLFWGAVYIWAMPFWSVAIEGREKIKKGRTYVIVSNHQSQLDILILCLLFVPFKWVSKTWVFRIPFVGWAMFLNRYIRLRGDDRKSIMQVMRESEKALSQGNSVLFFPEGTRSDAGVMNEFKSGAFIMAKKQKLPILPIAISGASGALPKGSLNFHGSHKIRVEVLDEIPYEEYAGFAPGEVALKVRKLIGGHVDEHQEAENVQS